MIRLPVIVLVVVGWTLLVLGVLLLTPSLTSAPPCDLGVQPGPGCQVLNDLANRFVWETQQRPMVLLSIGGYLVIAAMTIAGRRGRR
jgi:hypothetical protein